MQWWTQLGGNNLFSSTSSVIACASLMLLISSANASVVAGAVTNTAAASAVASAAASASKPPLAPTLFPNPKTITDWCTPLVARLPKVSLNDCRNSKVMPTGAKSVNGFPILARDFEAVSKNITTADTKPDTKRKPAIKILLIGGIHGDEKTASAIVFKWLDSMQKPAAQEFQWKVAPIVNPDGLLAAKSKRVNAHGVDLNRNFPTPNWEHDAPRYWANTTRSDPRRFPGKAPISEPESRWVFDTIEKFKPDVIISVHAPFGVLDFDGPVTPPIRFGRLMFNRVGVYPGSLGNYSGLHKDIPVVTIELPNATVMPPDTEVQRIWQDMLGWIKRNVPAQAKLAQR